MKKCKRLFQSIIDNRRTILLWIIVILFIAPFVASARYTVLWSDDFSDARHIREYGVNPVVNAFLYTKYMWLNFQGSYVWLFLQGVFNPCLYGEFRAVRLYAMLSIVIFSISFYLAVRMLLLHWGYSKDKAILVFALIYIPLFTYGSYMEVLYWYTGFTMYMAPISCFFLAIAINYIKSNKLRKLRLIGAVILTIMACGGTLQICAFVCYIVLMLLVYDTYVMTVNNTDIHETYRVRAVKGIKFDRDSMVLFVTAFIATLLNLCAPGNFNRNGGNEGRSLISAIFYSFKVQIINFDKYYSSAHTTMAVFSILFIILGIVGSKKLTDKCIFVISLTVSLLPVIGVFPVLLGYKYTAARSYYPSRVEFTNDMSFILAVSVICYCGGIFIRNRLEKQYYKKIIILLAALMYLTVIRSDKPITEYHPFVICDSLMTGQLREYANNIAAIERYVKESDEQDIVVKYNVEDIGWFTFTPLAWNDEYTNGSIATFYGKNSLYFDTSQD